MTRVSSQPVRSGCPVAHDLDPLDPQFLSVPFDYLAGRRAEGPVFYVPELELYFVTRYADIERIFLDRDTFGAANASAPLWSPCPAAGRILAQLPKKPTLNNADPPRHAPMRTAVLKSLTPRRIAAMEPTLQDVTRRLVDDIVSGPTADLMPALAFPLPGYAAFTLLGFPEEDWVQLKSWCRKRIQLTYGRLSEDDQVMVAETLVAFWEYCDQHVLLREKQPGDDVTSDLLAYARSRPGEVTRLDIVTIVYALALAGHDTTTAALTSGLRALLDTPGAWGALVADRTLVPAAVEEMLRYDPPLLGHRRVALADTQIGGVPIPAGAHLFLTLASAHRDAEKFADPDVFDVRREGARAHLSFGKGVHLCIGAPLARLEMRIALEQLADRAPAMRLVEGQDFAMVPNLVFRSLEQLRVHTGVAH